MPYGEKTKTFLKQAYVKLNEFILIQTGIRIRIRIHAFAFICYDVLGYGVSDIDTCICNLYGINGKLKSIHTFV